METRVIAIVCLVLFTIMTVGSFVRLVRKETDMNGFLGWFNATMWCAIYLYTSTPK